MPSRVSVDPSSLRAAARVYAEYQRILRDANAADFGDLLLWPVRAMMLDRAYRARWAGRFECVLMPTSTRTSTGPSIRGFASYQRVHRELFAVGDDDQSVYGLQRRGHRLHPSLHPGLSGGHADPAFEENFRSTGHILQAANAVIRAFDRARLGKTLYTRKPEGAPIESLKFRSDELEGAPRSSHRDRAHAGQEGVAWDEIAILYAAMLR